MSDEIRHVIGRGPMSFHQLVVIGICAAINMLDGFDVLVMAFTASSVEAAWQLDATELGILLSAGLFGMAAGSLFIAPLADRLGRRRLVLICLVIISVGMLLSAASQAMWQLAVLRVFTGLGIGGLLASLNVVVAEYSSDRWRSFFLSLLQTGYPIGAVLGGAITAVLLQSYGWRSVFVFGAIASTVMIPLVYLRMPDSLDYLLARNSENALAEVNKLLQKIKRPLLSELPPQEEKEAQRHALVELFDVETRRSTVMVWLCFFMVMFSFYFVLSWTPKLLTAVGYTASAGVSAGVLINLGGIAGGVLLGVAASAFKLTRVVSVYMLLTVLLMVVFGLVNASFNLTLALGVCIGFFLFGSMIGMYAIVPDLYSPAVRATGMGWAIGLGRIGAILSPFFAGILLDLAWNSASLYIVFAMPLLISMVIVSFIRRPTKV